MMGDDSSGGINIDLNVGPDPEVESVAGEHENLDDWIDDPIELIREAVRIRSGQRWRQGSIQDPSEMPLMSVGLDQFVDNSNVTSTLQIGEGSNVAAERSNSDTKLRDAATTAAAGGDDDDDFLESRADGREDDAVKKDLGGDGGFFDCNICFDQAAEPVVTCCGHLFCWPCLYRWLHMHSDANECPVCKGEVTLKSLIPIFGRGSHKRESEQDPGFVIPLRPQARRIESLRQTYVRNSLNVSLDEMIRRIGGRLEVLPESTPARDAMERNNFFWNRIMSYRDAQTDHSVVSPMVDVLGNTRASSTTAEQNSRLQSFLLRRSQSYLQRSPPNTSLMPTLSSSERIYDPYARNTSAFRSFEQAPTPMDDRDSFSSIAAAINSESQVDTTMEIDSFISLSSTNSRRRSDVSRSSDVESGDSRPLRRRRLN